MNQEYIYFMNQEYIYFMGSENFLLPVTYIYFIESETLIYLMGLETLYILYWVGNTLLWSRKRFVYGAENASLCPVTYFPTNLSLHTFRRI